MRVALCVIVKKENRYLAEFVDYYRNLGFSHVYVCDNNDMDGERPEDAVRQHVADGFVEVLDYRGVAAAQMGAYSDCYLKHGPKYDWMAFFDADEFLTFSKESRLASVAEFLSMDRFADVDVVCVNWMCYGDNGKLRYEPGSVVERFPAPMAYDKCVGYNFPNNCHVKSFLRGGKPIAWTDHPHCPGPAAGGTWRACDANGRLHAAGMPFSEYDFSVAYLRHYLTKTAEEFSENVQKGYALPGFNQVFVLFQIENKFFGVNEKTPDRLAVLAENIPWYKVGLGNCRVRPSMQIFEERNRYEERVRDLESQLKELGVEYAAMRAQYEGMSNSTCWKLTKPIRRTLDYLKAIIRKGQ